VDDATIGIYATGTVAAEQEDQKVTDGLSYAIQDLKKAQERCRLLQKECKDALHDVKVKTLIMETEYLKAEGWVPMTRTDGKTGVQWKKLSPMGDEHIVDDDVAFKLQGIWDDSIQTN
jgi:hypothetical protein